MESSIAVFLMRQLACEQLPTSPLSTENGKAHAGRNVMYARAGAPGLLYGRDGAPGSDHHFAQGR